MLGQEGVEGKRKTAGVVFGRHGGSVGERGRGRLGAVSGGKDCRPGERRKARDRRQCKDRSRNATYFFA